MKLKGKKRSVLSKNMTNTFSNSKSCRKQKLCVNVQQKYRKYVVLAVIVCFAYFKSKDAIEWYPTDLNSAHPNYVASGKAKFNVSYFSPGQIHTFSKKAAIFSLLKIYMTCTNLNTTQFKYIIHLGSENIGQLHIQQIIMFH